MMKYSVGVAACALLASCGGSPRPPETATAPPPQSAAPDPTPAPAATTTQPAVPEADPAESTQRAKDAAKWLADMAEDEPAMQGRLATNGLSEEQFGLPAAMRKGMEAATSLRYDNSQVDRIISATLEEGAPKVVMELCGKPIAALVKEVLAVPESARTKLVIERCQLATLVDASNIPPGSAMFPLLSGVVQKIFISEGGHSKAELELAKLIAVARRPTP